MSWIKNFRLRYGLTQSQLARFVGLTRNYIAVLEGRTEIPPFLERLLFDLEAEFESASNSQEGFAPQSHPFQQQKRLSQLQRIIKKKKAQLLRLEKKFASLETRYANLAIFQRVCQRWKGKQQDHDPLITEKINSLLAEKKAEMLLYSPEALSVIRICIIRLRSEVEAAEHEYQNLSPISTSNEDLNRL
jgi:transcriptional regulator with XRE-family HTH domain